MTAIVTDKPRKYTKFFSETLDRLNEKQIDGIAIAAICKDGTVETGYWNMDLRDKVTVHTNIQYDCIDQFLRVNKDRYLSDDDEEDDDDAEDQDEGDSDDDSDDKDNEE